MKRYLGLASVLTALATALVFFTHQPSAHGAQPTLNRGVQAYAFGAILDDSTANTQSSDVVELYEINGASFQVDHGNITGTLALKASNDNDTFYACPDVTFTAVSGTGGEVVEVGNLRSRYYRVDYTHSSGTGAIKITLHAKGRD